jgi:hypothetical protein
MKKKQACEKAKIDKEEWILFGFKQWLALHGWEEIGIDQLLKDESRMHESRYVKESLKEKGDNVYWI